MKWNGDLPITDRFAARVIAQAYVRHGCNMKEAVEEELRPEELTSGSAGVLASQLLHEPAVLYEIGVIMDRKNDAPQFVQKMWEWLNAPPDDSKETAENRRTAARILAKGYIREKGPAEAKDQKPMVIAGLEEGIGNLTGETPVVVEKDPGKVM